MKITKEDLISKINKKKAKVEKKAFKLYCTDQLIKRLDRVAECEVQLDNANECLDATDIDSLRVRFDGDRDFNIGTKSIKQEYINKVTAKKQ